MADNAEKPAPDCVPPGSIRVGVALVLAGVVLACLDLAAETAVSVRLLIFGDDSQGGTSGGGYYAIVALRVLVYLGAVVVTIVQRRRTRRRENRARVTLVVLLFTYAAGCVANFAVTWFELIMAGLASGRLGSWPGDLAMASLAADGILLVLAVTGAVLLMVGGTWTRSRLSQAAGTVGGDHT